MKSLPVLLAMLAVLSGCMISKPVAPAAAAPGQVIDAGLTTPADGLVQVTVVRDTGYISSACPFVMFVDTARAASLMPGQKVDLYLAPGEYILSLRPPPKGACKWGPVVQQNLIVRPDKPARYRAGYYGDTYILEPSIL